MDAGRNRETLMKHIEFQDKNGSKVKRFSTEQPRSAQNIEKMYTSGVFGGLPQFEEV